MEQATRIRWMYISAGCAFAAALVGLIVAYVEGASVMRSIATVALPVALGCAMINVAKYQERNR